MEEKIITYLQAHFNPVAIILHGSRASGHERPHSDWDFVLLYNNTSKLLKDGRTKAEGENIEFTHHVLPVSDVTNEFGIKLQNARVVYQEGSIGTDIVKQTQIVCTAPLGWSVDEKRSHSLWMRGRIDGMRDTINQPLIYEKYAADLYACITNYWYWVIHDRYAKPIYLALEEIKKNDVGYFVLVENFIHATREEKITVAEEIYKKCFE